MPLTHWTNSIEIFSFHVTTFRIIKSERASDLANDREAKSRIYWIGIEYIKMPSRLIQGLDNLDTCSQFSDSATLHTLTRMGALQKEVYFSRSESNFNNFDTISYGNSSTCCCDAEIKVINLILKISIWIISDEKEIMGGIRLIYYRNSCHSTNEIFNKSFQLILTITLFIN